MSAQDQVTAIYESTSAPSKARRSVAIASLGNILEWYDFTVYGFVVVYIARNFFPSTHETAALLATFAAFGAGFVARPLGAIIFGRIADTKGRRFVLLFAMFLMAGASVLIGISPTYATIGLAAPALILLARLAQGLSAGAEFGGAAAYLIEWAPESKRGFFASFHQVGTYGGLLLGVGTVAIISSFLTPAEMEAWGWRIPFLLGGLLAVVALYMRRNVEETPRFKAPSQAVAQRQAPNQGSSFFAALQSVGVVALWSVTSFAVMVYMTTYTQRYGGLSAQQALWSTSISTLIGVFLIPVFGAVSDRLGRRPVFGAGAAAFILLPIPFYGIIASAPGFQVIVLLQIVMSVFTAMIAGVGPAIISELFPTERRATMVGISSAIAVTVFGGFAPFISTILIDKTGSATAPAYYVAVIALFTTATVFSLRETSRGRLQ
ncbi:MULTISPECIES: MFS transporter [unclassified Beijerinckia]|uniref:MFS transporter n=1 Tax=unclassified Beijerinckia TaxID=2638183 RepID=UPI0008981712|nr:MULTISPECIES: MFS transporter [unclassified Beijerinckia]MDH7797843.1 MHS family proline/betaine transporter-like MFS transporter [Beijerinckia sp. GAS462]SED00414.1 MFS transporter, MHS family, proline/betaine transporter [Beijerinckia sp. 28-YEA-48]